MPSLYTQLNIFTILTEIKSKMWKLSSEKMSRYGQDWNLTMGCSPYKYCWHHFLFCRLPACPSMGSCAEHQGRPGRQLPPVQACTLADSGHGRVHVDTLQVSPVAFHFFIATGHFSIWEKQCRATYFYWTLNCFRQLTIVCFLIIVNCTFGILTFFSSTPAFFQTENVFITFKGLLRN